MFRSAARLWNSETVSVTAPLRSKAVHSSGVSLSAIRDRVTIWLMSRPIRSPSLRMSSSHSFFPTSDSTMSRLDKIRVRGVVSSWLASVMNCFCLS